MNKNTREQSQEFSRRSGEAILGQRLSFLLVPWGDGSEPFNLGVNVPVSLWPGRVGDIRLHRHRGRLVLVLSGGPGTGPVRGCKPLLPLNATQ